MICMRLCLVTLFFGAYGSQLMADDWPQWRGPDRMNVSAESNLMTSWPEEGPPRVWVFDNAGLGYSGFSVVGDSLFTMGARDGRELLICVNVTDGTERWSAEVGDVYDNDWGNGPRSTPTVDGDHVYTLGARGDLICAQVADGQVVWTAKMEDLGGSIPGWGYSESVLVDGDLVICTPGGESGTLAALNKLTGEVVWRSADWTDGAQYSSPIVVTHAGVRQFIQLTKESLAGVRADNGEVLWKTEWPGSVAVIPTPVYHDGYVYATAGYGVGCNLYKLDDNQQVTEVYGEEVKKVMKNHVGGVLYFEGNIYGYSDSSGWVCQDFLTGEQKWRERNALGKGTLTCADSLLYCLSEDEGVVALVKPSPEAWTELARFTLEPQTDLRKPKGRIWVPPVIANGKLYLRDQELISCYDIEQK